MLKKIIESLHTNKIESLAKSFSRLGWIGFWLQVILGSIPVVLMFYIFAFSGNLTGPRTGLQVVEFLSTANLLVLLFSTIWFYRYTGVAKQIANPSTRPTEGTLVATVWTGLLASSLGILISMTVMILEVGHLLFYFLAAPQGGIPAVQTTAGNVGSWVSAVDLMSLMSLLLMLAAEVMTLVLGLWLLFRTTQNAGELAQPAKR